MNFYSDNTAAATPEVLAAIARGQSGCGRFLWCR